jgi:hypothetical protein
MVLGGRVVSQSVSIGTIHLRKSFGAPFSENQDPHAHELHAPVRDVHL